VPLQRMEFVQRFSDQHRNQLDPGDLGLPPGIPAEVPHVVTFESVGDQQTELSVTEYGYPSQQLAELSRAGMQQVLDKLARSL
jgi:Activator of Hsp90 ATPase homolog 1-like protein